MTARSLSELHDLRGRKALVAGGAGHIGRAVCETLLELGALVVILDRDEHALESSVNGLGAAFGKDRVLGRMCDLVDDSASRQVVKNVLQRTVGLDILIHCAAYTGTTRLKGWAVPFEEQTVDAWDAAMRVNLTSVFVLAQECYGPLRASGRGSVVLFSSIYGMVAPDFRLYTGTSMGNPAAYAASKAGILQLTRYLASAWAPAVRVNAITPGGIWRNQHGSFVERYLDRTPMKRMGTEEDMKGAVAYLATDLSSYVTGQNLVVDGGWTAW